LPLAAVKGGYQFGAQKKSFPYMSKMKKDGSGPGLATALSVYYVLFTVVALLVFGGMLLALYVKSHKAVISEKQRYIAQDAARTVSDFIREKTDILSAMLRMDDPMKLTDEKKIRYLDGLLGIQPPFRRLVLLDAGNRIVTQVSRFSAQASAQFIERLEKHPLSRDALQNISVSPVYFDPVTSEPLVILTVPVLDILRDYEGYLAGELNLKFMWELVDRLNARAGGNAYVVDRQGNLIAFGDTARVFRVENVSQLKSVRDFIDSTPGSADPGVDIYTGIMGNVVAGSYSALGTPDWAVVVEVNWDDAYRPVVRNILLSAALFVVFSLLAGLLGIAIAWRLALPLVRLTDAAVLVAGGADHVPVETSGPREVARLSAAFNSMTSQLLQSHADLEKQLVEVRAAQEALRDSEERLRAIINNANEIIYTLSPDGVFAFVSPAWTRLLGHDTGDIEGRPFSLFVHPEDFPACEAFLEKVLSSGQPQQGISYRVKHMDGTWKWHTSVGSAILDSRGQPTHFVGIAQDITWNKQAEAEKAKLEQQLFQALKMESIGRLAGGVAHDFNNMLNVILGYSELIRLDSPGDEPLLRKISEIERAAGNARDTTRQLLAFSRKQIIAPVSLDMNDVIRENRNMLARLIGEDIDLQFFPGQDLWKVKLDPTQLNQVVYNLAINARDAMPNGGKLTIETANAVLDETYSVEHVGFYPGHYVLLTVSDNGIGMDRETQAHLFEPFFTTKEIGKGTGLGLATIYGIIKQNGGFINVYSETGSGTSFHLYFLRDTEGVQAGIRRVETPVPSGEGTILLVEDDEMVRSMTKMSLQRLGYHVLALATPIDAITLCKQSDVSFLLLITDVVMPGMSGIELKKRMASLKPGIKVLFMSGYTANTIVHQGVLDRDVHFLQKPFNLDELARKVKEAIAG
jgi:PAS domain S-box-containing protein